MNFKQIIVPRRSMKKENWNSITIFFVSHKKNQNKQWHLHERKLILLWPAMCCCCFCCRYLTFCCKKCHTNSNLTYIIDVQTTARHSLYTQKYNEHYPLSPLCTPYNIIELTIQLLCDNNDFIAEIIVFRLWTSFSLSRFDPEIKLLFCLLSEMLLFISCIAARKVMAWFNRSNARRFNPHQCKVISRFVVAFELKIPIMKFVIAATKTRIAWIVRPLREISYSNWFVIGCFDNSPQ